MSDKFEMCRTNVSDKFVRHLSNTNLVRHNPENNQVIEPVEIGLLRAEPNEANQSLRYTYQFP